MMTADKFKYWGHIIGADLMNMLISAIIFFALVEWGCERAPNQPDQDDITLELFPREIRLASNDTTRIHLTIKDASGKIVSDRVVKWNVNDSTIIRHLGNGLIRSLKEGQTLIQAEVEAKKINASVSVFDFLGRAKLQNQTDHSAIKISYYELGATQPPSYLPTDSSGFFILPRLNDGLWVIAVNYPYYKGMADTIKVVNGKPEVPLVPMLLHQQIDFEVILDKSTYSITDTVWMAFKATNLSSDSVLTIRTGTYPAFVSAVALTKQMTPVLASTWDYVILPMGQPAVDKRQFNPKQTILESPPHSYDRNKGLYIDLSKLYQDGAIKIGETYQVFAAYPASQSYPREYFAFPSSYGRIPYSQLFSWSLYKKLKYRTIKIMH